MPSMLRPASKHRRLHLRGRHRHAVGDRRHRIGAADRQRQAVAGARDHLRPHFAERLEHAAPSAGATARRRRRKWWRNDARRRCPWRGARRFRHCRSRSRPPARAARRCRARGPARRRRGRARPVAPKARMAAAVAITSADSSSPPTRVSPIASAPSMSARCEIDLSPGTATRPLQRAGRQRAQRLCEGVRHGCGHRGSRAISERASVLGRAARVLAQGAGEVTPAWRRKSRLTSLTGASLGNRLHPMTRLE